MFSRREALAADTLGRYYFREDLQDSLAELREEGAMRGDLLDFGQEMIGEQVPHQRT